MTTQVNEPKELSNRTPSLRVSWDPAKLHITGEEIAETFGRTKPRIALGAPLMYYTCNEWNNFIFFSYLESDPCDRFF